MRSSTFNRIETPMMLRAQTASDLMVPNPISIRAEASVADALTLFTEKRINAAPVIDEAGQPIGVVSQSDLLIHQCEHEKKRAGAPDYFFAPVFKSYDAESDAALDSQSTVADVMTPAIFAVAPDTPVDRVVRDMVGLHVHRLFVVDADGILVGVITTMDVLKQLRSEE